MVRTVLKTVYLVHWPVAMNPKGNHPVMPMLPNGNRDIDESRDIKDTWKDMEAMLKTGKVKSIGVSNFSQKTLEKILPTAEIIPAINQVRSMYGMSIKANRSYE